ncbi:MAG: type II secretion system protein GspK [Proteobacteria bacterium]|nr:type II secretion system protein GspK [Pseudomonadota bacterium]MDA1309251.1 type II secretion system protein GspK [Pseudomonadota bacterium]
MIRKTRRIQESEPEAGMALVLVLGGLIVLSVISIGLLSLASRAVTVGTVEVDRARATALVEGAIEAATLALFAPDGRLRFQKTGGEGVMDVAGQPITVRVRDACGLWDLNQGDPAIFSRLLKRLGAADPALSVDALIAARGVEAGLLSVDQLRGLPGIDADLFRALRSNVTVNCRADRVDPDFASTALLTAIPGLTPDQAEMIIRQRREGLVDPPLLASSSAYLAPGPGQTYEITAAKAFGPGSRVFRRAEITLTHQPKAPYRVLTWSRLE